MNLAAMLDAIADADQERLLRFQDWALTQAGEDISTLLWAADYRRTELEIEGKI